MRNINEMILFPFLNEEYALINCRFKRYDHAAHPSGISRKTHFHHAIEVHFVEKGELVYEVDGEILTINAGEYILLGNHLPHRRLHTGEKALTYHITYQPTGYAYRDKWNRRYCKSMIPPDIQTTLVQFGKYFETHKNVFRLPISIAFFEMICLLSDLFSTEETGDLGHSQDTRILLAKQYINAHMGTPITCQEVADACYISGKQLARLFHKYEGISLKAYIDKEKIRAAEELIAQKALTFKEISEALGFCNEYYFHTFFKKSSGMTPGEYRASLQ